tara:strand:+ start:294 stop:470 length:177 start_codon:yes stop_codon:yes gene_type:complete
MKNKLEIVRCKNGVGEWEISPLHETFDTRQEAEKRLQEIEAHEQAVIDNQHERSCDES